MSKKLIIKNNKPKNNLLFFIYLLSFILYWESDKNTGKIIQVKMDFILDLDYFLFDKISIQLFSTY